MHALLEIDYALFQWINIDWSNPAFDVVLPALRDKYFWIPLYVFIISFIAFNYRIKAIKILFILFLVVGVSDGVSSHLIKKNVQRIRPCNVAGLEVVKRINCGSGYSFTSSHAANHFAIASILILLIFRKRWVRVSLIFWASLISIAQVYVGVHYPLDIIGGAILGILIARLGQLLYLKWEGIPLIPKESMV